MRKRTLVAAFSLGLATMFLVCLMTVPAFAASVAKTITVYTGITLYYNGAEVTPKDAAGKKVEPLLYNGTTYLPVRAVSTIFKENISWDGSTRSVYIGDAPGVRTYLGSELEPYSGHCGYSATLEMDGKTYTNCIKEISDAIFNLNGQYNTLEFDIGHDGVVGSEKALEIYLDGSLAKTVTLEPEEMVKHVTVPLNGAIQMKLDGSYDMALSNAVVY